MNYLEDINIDTLHLYIQNIAGQMIDLASSENIATGTILEAHPGYYIVQLNNSNTTNSVISLPLHSENTYKKDDFVYLLKASIASGDLQQTKYFIFGLVSDTQEEFFNLTEWERFQGLGGKVSLKSKEDAIEVFSYSSFEEKEIDIIKETDVGGESENFILNVKEQGSFCITGIFTLLNAASNIKNYGLVVKLLKIDDNTASNTIVSSYYLDTNYFTGQPFNTYESFQKRIVVLDKDYDFNAISISLYAQSKSELDIWQENDSFYVRNITLQAGSLMDIAGKLSVKIDAQEGKNYFYKNKSEKITDTITLVAEAYYNNQLLSASTIQYYWLIKDDSITEESENGYLSFAGSGWRCLNSSNIVPAIGVQEQIRIWDNKKNSISFNKSSDENSNIFSEYENLLKCIVKYQGAIATSDIFKVYDFEKEDFEITITSDVEPKILFLESDKITLSATITSRNKYTNITNTDITYQWYKKDNLNDESTPVFVGGEPQLIIKDNGNTEESDYEIDTNSVYFYCVATITKGKDSWTETSESILITSKVAVAAELKLPTYYKYYISASDAVLFSKKSETGEDKGWKGDWLIEDPTKEKADWISIEDKIDNEAFDYLQTSLWEELIKEDSFSNDAYYLYYTSQTKWYEQKPGDDTIVELKTENWTVPRLLRGKLSNEEDDLPFETIDKINTFNDLTGGGKEQGIYLEDIYYRTEDTVPIPNKTYYYITFLDGKPIYTKFEGEVFLNDVQYYELQGEKKLYINAEYIQTGALKVGNNEGDLKFYADIDKNDVTIAGFAVSENSISASSGFFKAGTDEFYLKYFNSNAVIEDKVLNDFPEEDWTINLYAYVDNSIYENIGVNESKVNTDTSNKNTYSTIIQFIRHNVDLNFYIDIKEISTKFVNTDYKGTIRLEEFEHNSGFVEEANTYTFYVRIILEDDETNQVYFYDIERDNFILNNISFSFPVVPTSILYSSPEAFYINMPNFSVNNDGILKAKNAEIEADIIAKNLTILEGAEITGLKANSITVYQKDENNNFTENILFKADADAGEVFIDSLSTLSANMGTITAGKIQSKNFNETDFQTILKNEFITNEYTNILNKTFYNKTYYPNNQDHFIISSNNFITGLRISIQSQFNGFIKPLNWEYIEDISFSFASSSGSEKEYKIICYDSQQKPLTEKEVGKLIYNNTHNIGQMETYIELDFTIARKYDDANISFIKLSPVDGGEVESCQITFIGAVIENTYILNGGLIDFEKRDNSNNLIPCMFFPGITINEKGVLLTKGQISLLPQNENYSKVILSTNINGLQIRDYYNNFGICFKHDEISLETDKGALTRPILQFFREEGRAPALVGAWYNDDGHHIPGIEMGEILISTTLTTSSQDITFPRPFKNPPLIFLQISGTVDANAWAYWDTLTTENSNLSSLTGFRIVYNIPSKIADNSVPLKILWIAFDKNY